MPLDGSGCDGGADNEALSLIANSIERIPVSREEFENKLGVPVFRSPSVVAAHAPADNESAVYQFPGGNSALCKLICLETATTETSSKCKKKKSLHASIQKCLEKWSRKQKRGIKFLPTDNNRPQNSEENLLNPRVLLDQYVRKVGGSSGVGDNDVQSGEEKSNNTREAGAYLGCGLLPERSPTSHNHSFALYHSGRLFEGEICCGNSGRSCSSHSYSNNSATEAVLQCAASLYYELWYFHTIQAKDVSRAYGFAVTANSSGSTGAATVWVTLLLLEKPRAGPIGGRYPLFEYTKRYDLVSDNEKERENITNNQNGEAAVLDDLGHFLLCPSLPCPFLDAPNLNKSTLHTSSPGYMLLPLTHQPQFTSIRFTKASCELSLQVVPTITGSLVIRCKGAQSVMHLLQLGNSGTGTKEENDMSELLANFEHVLDDSNNTKNMNDDDEWYVKYKTPSFGPFWDTAKIAINGTRSLLLHRQSSSLKKRHGTTKVATADQVRQFTLQEWLRMYPIDSLITQSLSITVMKSMGVLFTGRNQLSWEAYQLEFASLMKGTLYFQSFSNNLIHGDINEGNVLYDADAEAGSRLKMIDWDEALRGRPCHRQISSREERLRYPMELVTFPDQYTKQQLLHLFQKITRKHYCDDDPQTKDVVNDLLASMECEGKQYTSFLSRASVDARFKALLHFCSRSA